MRVELPISISHRAQLCEKRIAHCPEGNEREEEENGVRVNAELTRGWERRKWIVVRYRTGGEKCLQRPTSSEKLVVHLLSKRTPRLVRISQLQSGDPTAPRNDDCTVAAFRPWRGLSVSAASDPTFNAT